MKPSIFMLIFFLTLYPSISFAAMSAEESVDSIYIKQNKKLERIEIKSKDGRWCVVSKEYSGRNDDFRSRISVRIQNGKVYILSATGEEVYLFNAGLHPSVAANFDLVLEWDNNNLYVWGEKIGGKDKISNCERIMLSYERCKKSDIDNRIFRAVVTIRNYSNKIQIKDVRARECDKCWCHVHRLNIDDEMEQ